MVEDRSKHVFIDESGDPYLEIERDGVSQFFVLTAIIVPSAGVKDLEERAQSVVKKHFQTGEMKSNAVGGDEARRNRILTDIAGVPFKHYSQVIDKAEVRTESGLRFKKSFIKFIHRAIYQRLLKIFPSLHVIADEYGTSDFMREFGRYLEHRLPRTLFETSSFEFGDSADYPFIQFADMIAGSIARSYSGADPRDLLKPIRANTIIIDEWPPKSPIPPVEDETEYDAVIRYQAVKQAQRFIDDNTGSNDPLVQAQIAAVRYLLYYFRAVDPEEYLPTASLKHHLSNLGFEMSERKLRSEVIGRLRDRSVFIVSSPKGIKIPLNVVDITRFVEQVDGKVLPYLSRLRVLREHFLLATSGNLEIVDPSAFPQLFELFDKDT